MRKDTHGAGGDAPLDEREISRIAYEAGVRESDAMDSLEGAAARDALRLVRHIRWQRDALTAAGSELAAERNRADDYAAEVFALQVLLARARNERDALSVSPGTPRDA